MYQFVLLSNIPWYGHTCLFSHSHIEGHLGCFQFGAVTNKFAMNTDVGRFLWETYSFSSLGKMPRRAIAGEYGK